MYINVFRDLSFRKGDIIVLRRKIDNNWYQGECNGVSGVFPLQYVKVMFNCEYVRLLFLFE